MPGQPAERLQQRVEARVHLVPHGLGPRGAVHVHDAGHPRPLRLPHGIGQDHVIAVDALVEVAAIVLERQRGAERSPVLAVLHLEVEPVLHVGEQRAGQDRAIAERAGADLHAALEPAEDLALGQQPRRLADDVGMALVGQLRLADGRLDLRVGVFRPPVGVAEWLERAHAGPLGQHVGGAQRDAVVGRGRLHEDALHLGQRRELAVHAAVHGHAAGQAQVA